MYQLSLTQQRSVDFFQALCEMTSGVMLPLLTADILAFAITASVIESLDMERLVAELGPAIAARFREKGGDMAGIEEVAK